MTVFSTSNVALSKELEDPLCFVTLRRSLLLRYTRLRARERKPSTAQPRFTLDLAVVGDHLSRPRLHPTPRMSAPVATSTAIGIDVLLSRTFLEERRSTVPHGHLTSNFEDRLALPRVSHEDSPRSTTCFTEKGSYTSATCDLSLPSVTGGRDVTELFACTRYLDELRRPGICPSSSTLNRTEHHQHTVPLSRSARAPQRSTIPPTTGTTAREDTKLHSGQESSRRDPQRTRRSVARSGTNDALLSSRHGVNARLCG